ncbi:metalloregulator ArsR/SmtB family transcription factor [Brevibacillus humidisoli]|uniref:ArsR/SmtB family transcription factor n=1 Tax=Brevibacillus humidisoli TaxID=2895522 RepID=UPI001E607857|nr:metalloregulator ArsR/SmtB family transcription factor [Brevibacillus humidisoli]UFJ43428.1 metalloregulator ArsR/SmtB family transcription factor [Brevibacillus humidisoli]
MEPSEMMHLLDMSDLFKILGDKTRLAILALLHVQALCVRDIVMILQVSQPSISQHLAKLKGQGLVKESKKGSWVLYSINDDCEPIVKAILDYLPDLRHRVKELERRGLKAAL